MNQNLDNSNREWQPSPGDELGCRLLDDAVPAASLAATSPDDLRRLVDLQFLDALLEQSYGHNQTATSQAIAATLTRLQDEPQTSSTVQGSQVALQPAAYRSSRWIGVALAASLLVGLFLVSSPRATRSAYAMVERAYQVALEARDREYRVTLSGGGPGHVLPREATLRVRGGEKFLLTIAGPMGGINRIGRDDTRFWYVPPAGRVFAANEDSFLGNWLRSSSADMPYLKLTTLLERLRDTYELSVLPDESIDAQPTNHMIARRRESFAAEHPTWPLSFELWTDPTSGVIRKAKVTRPAEAAGFAGEHILFELVSEDPVEDSVYELTSYTRGRPVVTLPASSK